MENKKKITLVLIVVNALFVILGIRLNHQKTNNELVATEVLNNLFTSNRERYDWYLLNSDGEYDLINRDENFLNRSYNQGYLELYSEKCTENCLEVMTNAALFTYVDYLADISDAVITVKDIVLRETDEYKEEEASRWKEKHRRYHYVVTINCRKNEEFSIQGKISVVNLDSVWKVDYIMLSDYDALGVYILE